jgi:hypothetical protein
MYSFFVKNISYCKLFGNIIVCFVIYMEPSFFARAPAQTGLKKVRRPIARVAGTTKSGVVAARYVSAKVWAHALEQLSKPGANLRDVARNHNVDHVTLWRRFKGNLSKETVYGPAPVLTAEVETHIATALQFLCVAGMAMTMVLFIALLKRIAAAFGINTKVSRGLVDGFFHRHPELHKKRGEILEESRAVYFSQERVEDYFARLKTVVDGVHPSKIWNMDECGIEVENLKDRGKVITWMGMKGRLPRHPDRSHITVVACANAEGKMTMPLLIYKGKKIPVKVTSAYPEAHYAASDSGFINSGIYVEWVKIFIKESGGNCVLIADQHISRFDPEAINLMLEANVKLLLMPPHCTHHLQPADVSFFGAFKGALIAAMAVAGALSTHFTISGSIKTALAAATVYRTDAHGYTNNNWTSGFRKCGIFPYNPAAIDPIEYVPAATRAAARETEAEGLPPLPPEDPAVVQERIDTQARVEELLLDPAKMLERFGAHGKTVAAARERKAVILTGHEAIAAMLVKMEKAEAEETAKKARLAGRVAAREQKAAMKAQKAATRDAKKAEKGEKVNQGIPRAGPKRKRREAYIDSGTETDEEDMSPAAKAAAQDDLDEEVATDDDFVLDDEER